MYYIQPPTTYDQTTFNLLGDYDSSATPVTSGATTSSPASAPT